MKSKKDVIIIEENPHFTNKLKEKLEDKVNIINIESIKEALECCGISSEMKYEKGNICPDIVVIGDGCKISEDLQNRLKESLPAIKERFIYSIIRYDVRSNLYDALNIHEINEKINFLDIEIRTENLLLMVLEVEKSKVLKIKFYYFI